MATSGVVAWSCTILSVMVWLTDLLDMASVRLYAGLAGLGSSQTVLQAGHRLIKFQTKLRQNIEDDGRTKLFGETEKDGGISGDGDSTRTAIVPGMFPLLFGCYSASSNIVIRLY